MKTTPQSLTPSANEKTKSFFCAEKDSAALPFFQPKLTVGPVNDAYEQEADKVAEQVVAEDHTNVQTKISPFEVQRKCAHCEEEEKLQRKSQSENELRSEAPSIVSDAINSTGISLDNGTKSFMEDRFGFDFSDVRIHTNAVATKSAEAVNALAYTSGNNIVFNEGQYNPSTHQGQKLLAHELTHVVQQGNASSAIQRQPKAQPQPKVAAVCPAFPASGVQVIGSFANELASALTACSGKEVTLDANQKLQLSNKVIKGAKKNASATASVSGVINNKVGIIVDTDPKSLGTTVGAFDHDCPGRQFVNVKNIEVQAKATGVNGGLDTCSSILHEMEEAVQARTIGSKAKGDELFKQSHAKGTTVENAIRKDANLPLRNQSLGDTVVIGKLSADQMLVLESTVYGTGKKAKTQLNVLVCTIVPKNATEATCANEVKASHVVNGLVPFPSQDKAIEVFNKYASNFGFKPLKVNP
jgi:hypothetical protein